MDAGFVALFRHHAWATDRLFAACEGLPEEHLEFVTQGTYGGLGSTLRHLVEAEERYVSRLRGEGERPGPAPNQPDPPSPPEALAPSVRVLRRRVRASAEALIELAASFEPDTVLHTTFRGEPVTASRDRPVRPGAGPRRRAPDPGPPRPDDAGLRAARHRCLGLGRRPQDRRGVGAAPPGEPRRSGWRPRCATAPGAVSATLASPTGSSTAAPVDTSAARGGLSSIGRASDCGSEGYGFNPRRPPQLPHTDDRHGAAWGGAEDCSRALGSGARPTTPA